jgi:hypothetical protein
VSERGLQWEQNLVGWLAHSPSGRREYSAFHIPGVLSHAGADRYVTLLLEHGPGSAGARLKDMLHTGSLDPNDAETAIRWAAGAPSVDDAYMLETARVYLRHRCHAVHAEQVALAADVWDDKLLAAAGAELRQRLAMFNTSTEPNGFTGDGLERAFSVEKQEDLFRLPGYVGKIFRGRLVRGGVVVFQAQPKTGKSATLARMDTAALRYGRNVLHVSVGDEDQYETAARIVSCEFQRNGQPYEDGRNYRGVPCCAKAMAGCDAKCYADNGYGPLSAPCAAQYLEETEVTAILAAFPSFRPCTLCKGTPEYVPGIWWEMANDTPITKEEAREMYDRMVACGEYGRLETLFFPARKVNVSQLAEMIDQRAADGRPVDVLTVDYADMLGIDMKGKGAKWEALMSMWEELRGLAAEKNILVLTATQGNRAGGDMTTQNSTSVAGTRASVDNATLVVALNQTPSERAHHLLRFSVVAARKGSFAPEHQAMCLSRLDIQDPMADSWHCYRKPDARKMN